MAGVRASLASKLRASFVVVVTAASILGCDDGANKTGTQVKPTEGQITATNDMANFMKKGAAPAKGASTPAPAPAPAPAK